MTDYQKHQLYLARQIYDKYVASDDVNYKNNGLATLMTSLETVFEIPLMSGAALTTFIALYPEVYDLYVKVANARDFGIMPDVEDDSCTNCDCYDYDSGQCTMPSIDLAYACPLRAKNVTTVTIVVTYFDDDCVKYVRRIAVYSKREYFVIMQLFNDLFVCNFEIIGYFNDLREV